MTIVCLFLSLTLSAQGNCFVSSADYECAEGQDKVLIRVLSAPNNVLTIPSWVTTIQSNDTVRFSFPNDVTTVYFEANSQLTSIGPYAFSNSYQLTNVSNYPLNSIPDYLFYSSSHVNFLSFQGEAEPSPGVLIVPQKITSIGEYSFRNCAFSTLIFEDNSQLSTIGPYAFSNSDTLTRVSNYPLDTIPDHLFHYSSKVNFLSFYGETEPSTDGVLVVPQKMTSIGEYSFSSCNFNTINFEDNQSISLGIYAFANNYELTRVSNYPLNSIPNGSLSYSRLTFLSFYGETEPSTDGVLFVPKKITSIGDDALSGCPFSSINFENDSQLTTIGSYAFSYNSQLRTVSNYPLLSISDYLFSGCRNLESFVFKGENPGPLYVLFIRKTITSIGNNAFSSCYFTTITFETDSELSNIGSAAFSNMQYLTNVFNFTLYSIPDSLFSTSRKLSFLSFNGETEPSPGVLFIPKKITSIGNNAFESCEFSTINFETGSELSSIGLKVFIQCSHLTQVFNFSLVNVSNSLFENCERLNFLSFNGEAEPSAGVLFIPKRIISIGEKSFYKCNFTTINFESESELQIIDTSAFYNLYYLTHVYSYPLKTIPNELFNACRSLYFVSFSGETTPSLGALILPKKITSIGDLSFAYSDFSTITFESDSQLSSLGARAFYGMEYLTRVYNFPLVSINTSLFDQCFSLHFLSFKGQTEAPVGVLFVPQAVTYIGSDSFYQCNFTTIIFDTTLSLTSLESGTFGINSYLTRVINFPFVSIASFLFRNCPRLNIFSFLGETELPPGVLFIPKKIISIGNWAFADCGFTSIIFEADSSCSNIGDFVFSASLNLQSVYGFPRLSFLSDNLFADCSSLLLFTTSSYSDACNFDEGLYLYEELTSINYAALQNTGFSCYILPSGKSLSNITIGSNAFPDIGPCNFSFPSISDSCPLLSSAVPSSPQSPEGPSESQSNAPLIASVTVAACFVVIVIIVLIYFVWKKKDIGEDDSEGILSSPPPDEPDASN